jgi:hypothetical protein
MIESHFSDAVLMQYETTLPDGFDTGQIEQRIARVSAPFDVMPGLWFKLYAVNNTGAGALVNEYSSIYLWKNSTALRGLLTSDLFQNYAEAFLRPAVRQWLTFAAEGDLPDLQKSRFALRRTFFFPRQASVASTLESWRTQGSLRNALFRVVAFDPGVWEVNDLTVWSERPKAQVDGRLYSIAHVSLPQ